MKKDNKKSLRQWIIDNGKFLIELSIKIEIAIVVLLFISGFFTYGIGIALALIMLLFVILLNYILLMFEDIHTDIKELAKRSK